MTDVNASSDGAGITDPLLTSCAFCPWSILAADDADKTRKEQAHAERWHADIRPDTSELCARILGEHPDEQETILEAWRDDAREHGGIVDPNRVRERLLPRGLVRPQVLSAAYRVFKERGVLVEAGETVSTDVRGGNAGKPATLYKLVDIEERRTG